MSDKVIAVLDGDEIAFRNHHIQTFPNGDEVRVVDYRNSKDVIIAFKCGGTKSVYWKDLVEDKVSNPYQLREDGLTYRGYGLNTDYKIMGVNLYDLWDNVCKRTLCTKYKGNRATYEKCTLSEKWYNFQNFLSWAKCNLIGEKFQLDKDLLLKGNKLYSEDTCCFLPKEINTALITKRSKSSNLPVGVGVDKKRFTARLSKNGEVVRLGNFDDPLKAFSAYKIAKEDYFKEIALKYKDKIVKPAFIALMNRTVDING